MTTVIGCDNNGGSKEAHSCVCNPPALKLLEMDGQIPCSVMSYREAVRIVLQQVSIFERPWPRWLKTNTTRTSRPFIC